MIDVMTLEDTWYVPCSVTRKDVNEFKTYLDKFRREGNYCISLFEGDFMLNDDKSVIKVVRRRRFVGEKLDDMRYSKFLADEDVMYILKCAKALGYKFLLEPKYSN